MNLSTEQINNLLDFSMENTDRLNLFISYYKQYDPNSILEIIHTVGNMYETTRLTLIKQYIFGIVSETDIEPMFKIVLLQYLIPNIPKEEILSEKGSLSEKGILSEKESLSEKDSPPEQKKNEDYSKACLLLADVYKSLITSTTYKLELIKILAECSESTSYAQKYLEEVILQTNIESTFKYEHVLLSFEKYSFIYELMLLFMNIEKEKIRYRILSAQFLLVHKQLEDKAMNFLITTFNQTDYDVNTRADCADIVLKYGNEEQKIQAKSVIMLLGKMDAENDTIYDNAENVHTDEIDESVAKGIEWLISYDNEYSKIKSPTLQDIEDYYKSLDLSKEEKEAISSSLQRISFDRGVYSNYSLSLKHIALKVWKFINQHDSKDQMLQRMKEELIDIAGTCASGYVARLINVISGLTDFNLRISWRDQICANLSGRLNARAKALDNLNFQEKVLNEMAMINKQSGNKHYDKKNFMKFFREYLPEIVAELQEEFAPYITDTDFELYLRNALMKYEGEC